MQKTFQKLKQDPDLWARYWIREQVIDAIRAYFKDLGFHEVEVPLLLPAPSTEPFLEVFKTELKDDQGNKWQAFLPSSPEFALKKLLSAGSGSVFTITKSFRNGEGRSSRHNPEFTILEWYRTPGDYMDIARDFEGLMRFILTFKDSPRRSNNLPTRRVLEGRTHLKYQGKEYDLGSPWERISVAEAFQKYSGIDTETMLNEQWLMAKGKKKGYQVDESTTWEEIWDQIIANEIEPKLGQKGPTILYDYPIAQAALAKKARDPRFAERFEVFMGGLELGNCFSELTNWKEQKRRCLVDLAERKHLGRTEFPMDTDFIEALKMGMPETGGIAVGVDRLVALFADTSDIANTLFFPVSELFN
ncbi:EF-P lysine aminoacylase GenX [Candidatus Collierbacteria bacterium CG10_big_fil_rev_8_21_14_0_10_44_9]|uniref:EF-P lysine aminoacylase GenX n=1 Tax=Candidatus Collierbacteria bacterium CG10_big_fil_rev_8_21_14_0_10_44_9 TaxID=1974535 RepID=A0A2H0VJA8_9BACT|nr:MAG: EF-P lysine aminoacylase GenX [Candidatus Collierbacteria bacterium CG10_big_fil_rev_8_21_14_0_10_44_9]